LEHVRATRFHVPKITSIVTPPFLAGPKNQVDFENQVFQKYANLRLRNITSNVPKFATAAVPVG
jgi:hypothetical protein